MQFKPIDILELIDRSAHLSNKKGLFKIIRFRLNILKYKFKMKWPISILHMKSISIDDLSEFCSIFKSLEDIMNVNEFEGQDNDIYFKVNVTNNSIDRHLISSISMSCIKDGVLILKMDLKISLETGIDMSLEIREINQNYKIQRCHSTNFISEYDTNETSRSCFILIKSIIFYWYDLLFIKIKEKYLYEKGIAER